MNNTEPQKDGSVQRTKDVIDIDAVVPDDNREENLTTTDFAESLKNSVENKAPLSGFPDEENEKDNDEPEEEKRK